MSLNLAGGGGGGGGGGPVRPPQKGEGAIKDSKTCFSEREIFFPGKGKELLIKGNQCPSKTLSQNYLSSTFNKWHI